MKLNKFIQILQDEVDDDIRSEVEFVGIKWQDQFHPSAEVYPIEFVDAKETGRDKLTIKFVTTKHNP